MTLPSSVSIAGSTINSQICNPTDGDGNPVGFSGTSSSAAHLAGMVALLVSNTDTSMNDFDGISGVAVDKVQDYLQTHTIDDTSVAANAVGYDMSYGAGTSVLGSPTYKLNFVSNPTTATDQLPTACSSGALYVGLANPGAAVQDGSITNPYISIAEAMKNASSSQCVVIMPGEYVASIAAVAGTHTPAVLSYEAATTFAAPAATNLWSVIAPPISIFSNGLTVDGFVVQGAKTLGLYYPIISGIAPLVINGGSGAVIQNSNFSGFTVIGSDGYGLVKGSTNVQLKNNIFSGFVVPFTLSGTNNEFTTSKSNTAVLYVQDSTGVVLANNTFQSNSNTVSSLTSNTWLSAIVGIKNSGVNIYNNRFESNNTGALIGINAWSGSPLGGTRQAAEVRMVGNLFNSNTINGPLVHLFSSQDLRFVNNTVVSNAMNGASDYDGFFMYGLSDSIYGNMLGSAVEIHNNLFYNNGTVGRGLLQTVNIQGNNVGCGSIAVSGGGIPISNNWFSPTIGGSSFSVGACSDADPTDSAGLIQKSLNEPITAATFFGASSDAVNPFRLRPNTNAGLIGGINYGDNAALTAIFGSDLSGVKDLIGASRVVLSGTSNTSYQTANVDVGAYELAVAAPLAAIDGTQTINEDPVGPLVFNLTASGGYTQTFAITSTPANYDPNPTNACLGQPLVFTAPSTVIYCPPANFHTFYGAGNSNVPLTIGFSVVDNVFDPGNVKTGTVSITINPAQDDTPVATAFSAIADYNTPLTYQLTPSYQLGNFSLSGANGKDFPFTYSYVEQDNSLAGQNNNLLAIGGQTTVQVLTAALAQASSNGGWFTVNSVTGQTGAYKFTYRITDQDNQSSTAAGTMVVLPRLAQEGTYDDASFYVAYTGSGWTPSYNATAYNTTLHSTSVSGDSLEFPFNGAITKINLRSSTVAGASLKLEFKLNLQSGNNTYISYSAAQTASPGLVCTSSLNGQAPDGSSNFSNFSAVVTAYTVTCNGLPLGQAHQIRVTNNQNGAQFTIDSLEAALGYLKAGSYEETNSNMLYSSTWTNYVMAGPKGGSFAYTNTNLAQVKFVIADNIERAIIYRTVAPGWGGADVYVIVNSIETKIGTIPGNPAGNNALLWGQAFPVTVPAGTNRTLVIRNNTTTGLLFGFEALDLLLPVPPLVKGNYEETTAGLTYTGVWSTFAGAGPKGNSMQFSNATGAKVSFPIDDSVKRAVIYRTVAPGWGGADVYLVVNGVSTFVATIPGNPAGNTTLLWGQAFPVDLTAAGLPTTNRTLEIRKAADSTVFGFEAFELLGPVVPLVINTYEETNAGLTYTGVWSTFAGAGPKGNSMQFSNATGAKVSFPIDDSVKRAVIYRTVAPGWGGADVYLVVNGVSTFVATIPGNPAGNTTLLWGQAFPVDLTTAGLPTTNRTLEIRKAADSTVFGFEAFDLLGPILPLVINTYEETNAGLTYTGVWSTFAGAGPKGNSMQFSNATGAKVSFPIDDSVKRAVIYRTVAPGWGGADVYLVVNGVSTFVATIPGNPAGNTTLLWGQAFPVDLTTAGLPTTNRTLEVRKAADSTVFGFEAFDLLGPIVPLVINTYEETNAGLTYTGVWSTFAGAGPKGNSMQFSSATGAKVSFPIDDSVKRAVIYRTVAPGWGGADVYLVVNGVSTFVATIPGNPAGNNALLWGQAFPVDLTAAGLPTTNRTLEIRKAADSTLFGFEAFELLGPIVPLVINTYEETNAGLTYTGVWSTFAGAGPKGNSMQFSSATGAKVSFPIDDSVKRAVIYRTVALGWGGADVYLVVNGVSTFVATIPGNPAGNNALLWGQAFPVDLTAAGLPTTNRTLEIRKAADSTLFGFEAFDLLGPIVPLVINTYEETNTGLTYTGVWSTFAGAGPKGNSMQFSSATGAKVSFPIDDSVKRAVIYRTVAPGWGGADVYLVVNGVSTFVATIPGNPAGNITLLWGQAFPVDLTAAGLPTTNRTLEIRKAADSTLFGFEAFDLLGPIVPLVINTYEETNAGLTYTGVWSTFAGAGPKGNSMQFSNATGAKVSFPIDDSVKRAVIYRTVALGWGGADVYLVVNGVSTLVATIPGNPAGNTTLLWGQAFPVDLTAAGLPTTNRTLEVRKAADSTVFGFEAFELLGPPQAFSPTPGYYEESDMNFTYKGNWGNFASVGPSSNASVTTSDLAATLNFSFTGNALVIYRSLSATGGTYNVNIDSGAASYTVSTNGATSWQQPIASPLLSNGTHQVVITNTSASTAQPINFDAIRVVDTTLPLTPGLYQNIDPSIIYTGTWASNLVGPSAGTTSTTAANDTAIFTFTGTGFTVFTFNPTNGANMQICYDTVPTSANVCSVVSTVASPAQSTVGYATYGLKNGTYQVTVKHNGASGSQALYIDSVAVLGTPSTTLTAGTYENTNAGIVYAPGAYWTTMSNPSYSGGSIQVSVQQGATAQFKFTGNSLILYQSTSPANSSNAAICVVVPSTPVNAPNQCATFSQNNAATTFSSPIAFYGFGSGTNEVVIENRSAGKQLNIDKITVN